MRDDLDDDRYHLQLEREEAQIALDAARKDREFEKYKETK